jgi:uncharacterized DUF497 family protein
MHIEFDVNKNDTNIRDRGLSFERAENFDFDSALVWQDTCKPYPEVRFTALGSLNGRAHSLVFTEIAKGIRVISFRKANRRKVKRYEQETKS